MIAMTSEGIHHMNGKNQVGSRFHHCRTMMTATASQSATPTPRAGKNRRSDDSPAGVPSPTPKPSAPTHVTPPTTWRSKTPTRMIGSRVARVQARSPPRLRSSARAVRRSADARVAHAEAAPLSKVVSAARSQVLAAHKEILTWEGRSAFEEPYAGLEQAYAAAAKTAGEWLATRKIEKAALDHADTHDREVADLEFQIHELRAALAKLEQTVEEEKTKKEKRISELDVQTEGLQVDLLALALGMVNVLGLAKRCRSG